MDGLDANTRAVVATVAGAYALPGVFFALAPFVECEVLAAHCGEVYAFLLAVVCCSFLLLFGNDWFPGSHDVCVRDDRYWFMDMPDVSVSDVVCGFEM